MVTTFCGLGGATDLWGYLRTTKLRGILCRPTIRPVSSNPASCKTRSRVRRSGWRRVAPARLRRLVHRSLGEDGSWPARRWL